jgi:capsid protein
LARVATAFGIFVESPYPQDFMPAAGGSTDEASQPLEYLQPGSINKLRPGEKIGSVKAEQPGGAYEPFVNSRLRGASVGAGFSFEAFSNNYSGSSYSSARQAMLIERQLDRLFMSLMEGKLYSRVYRWFLETEMLNGLRLPGWDANPMPYLQVKWSRPRQEWIDPQKEANAVEKMLTLNLTTQTTEAENRGEDFDEICATRAAEVAKQKALGIYALDQEIQVAKVESQSQILAPEADPNADDTAPAKTAEEITHVN